VTPERCDDPRDADTITTSALATVLVDQVEGLG